MKKVELTDKLRFRLITLLREFDEQVQVVEEGIEEYIDGGEITKVRVAQDVSKMKAIFRNIDIIMKEI